MHDTMRGLTFTFNLPRELADWEVRMLDGIPGVQTGRAITGGALVRAPFHTATIVERVLGELPGKPGEVVRVDAVPPAWLPEVGGPSALVVPPEKLPAIKPETTKILKDYQRFGLEFFQRRLGGLAEYGCGLGKTLLGILFERSMPGRTLVLTRSAATIQWASQYERFCDMSQIRLQVVEGQRGYVVEPRRSRTVRYAKLRPSLEELAADPSPITRLKEDRGATPKLKEALKRLILEGPLRVGSVSHAIRKRLEEVGLVEIVDLSVDPDRGPWCVRSVQSGTVVSYHDHTVRPILRNAERAAYEETIRAWMAGEGRDAGSAVANDPALPARVLRAFVELGVYEGYSPESLASRAGVDVEEVRLLLARRAAQDAADQREAILDVPDDTEIVVVGYAVLTDRLNALMNWAPTTLIVDESQNCKNHARFTAIPMPSGKPMFERKKHVSASAQALAELSSVRRVLLLSATPDPEKTRDLWAQFDLYDPRAFGRFHTFATRYCQGYPGKYGFVSEGTSNVPELRDRMSWFRHKVEKREVAHELPPFTREMIFLRPQDLVQVRVPKSEWRAAQKRGPSALLELQLCAAAAAKRPWAGQRARDLLEEGLRIMIVTGRRKEAEELHREVCGRAEGYPCWVAHGEQTPKERNAVKDAFIKVKGGACLIGTIDAWGEAIDGLQVVHRLLALMMPWNHGKLVQLEGRLDRLGDDAVESVMEYAIGLGTVDEIVLDKVIYKAEQAGEVLDNEGIRKMASDLEAQERATEILAAFAQKLLVAERARKQLGTMEAA